MGYTTKFEGKFLLDKPLTEAQAKYLLKFANTRRMKRNPKLVELLPDPIREAVGLPIGIDGEYFVGGTGTAGQYHDNSIVEYNDPSPTQPGLWCQWVPNDDGTAIEWDGGEKFYNYIEWLEYIMDNFLIPWGYTLNGKVSWQGENPYDIGQIVIKNNLVRTTKVIEDIID
jgi:hypothetical protein